MNWRNTVNTRNTIGRILVAALLAAGTLAFLPSTAQAQESCAVNIQDYEGTAILSVDPLVVAPGGTVTITGQGFPPNSVVPMFANDVAIGEPVADGAGAFQLVYTIPVDSPAGSIQFSAVCGAFTLSSLLTVSEGAVVPVPPAPPAPLPVTGTDATMQLVQIAGALLAVGGLLLLANRRQAQRRRTAELIS
jgi:LPXTG-motif cell wall-anchored protein